MDFFESQSDFLKALSHPTRLAILDILRDGEQCVCHMETTLGLRQAYISQQLIILKNAGLVEARRDGLNLYYRAVKTEVFSILDTVGRITGHTIQLPTQKNTQTECPCPKCNVKAGREILQINNA